MNYDHDLVARARRGETPENQHDLNNAIAIYNGVVELYDESDKARAMFPKIVLRLEQYAGMRCDETPRPDPGQGVSIGMGGQLPSLG